MRLLIKDGETRILFGLRLEVAVGMLVCTWCVTDMRAPLPTVIADDEGGIGLEVQSPGDEDICEVAPVSRYQSVALGGAVGTLAALSTV